MNRQFAWSDADDPIFDEHGEVVNPFGDAGDAEDVLFDDGDELDFEDQDGDDYDLDDDLLSEEGEEKLIELIDELDSDFELDTGELMLANDDAEKDNTANPEHALLPAASGKDNTAITTNKTNPDFSSNKDGNASNKLKQNSQKCEGNDQTENTLTNGKVDQLQTNQDLLSDKETDTVESQTSAFTNASKKNDNIITTKRAMSKTRNKFKDSTENLFVPDKVLRSRKSKSNENTDATIATSTALIRGALFDYQCPVCDKIFKSLTKLEKHQQTKHDMVKPVDSQPQQSDLNTLTSTSTSTSAVKNSLKKSMNKHKNKKRNTKMFMCPHCTKKNHFRSKSAVINHIRFIHTLVFEDHGSGPWQIPEVEPKNLNISKNDDQEESQEEANQNETMDDSQEEEGMNQSEVLDNISEVEAPESPTEVLSTSLQMTSASPEHSLCSVIAPDRCSFCTKAFPGRRDELIRHIAQSHMANVFRKCPQCGEKIMGKANLKRHLKQQHGLELEQAFQLVNQKNQNEQVALSDGIQFSDDDDEIVFARTRKSGAEEPAQNIINQSQSQSPLTPLLEFVSQQASIGPLECPECPTFERSVKFSRQYHLNEHIKRKHNKGLKLHRCAHCSARFVSAEMLLVHSSVHNKLVDSSSNLTENDDDDKQKRPKLASNSISQTPPSKPDDSDVEIVINSDTKTEMHPLSFPGQPCPHCPRRFSNQCTDFEMKLHLLSHPQYREECKQKEVNGCDDQSGDQSQNQSQNELENSNLENVSTDKNVAGNENISSHQCKHCSMSFILEQDLVRHEQQMHQPYQGILSHINSSSNFNDNDNKDAEEDNDMLNESSQDCNTESNQTQHVGQNDENLTENSSIQCDECQESFASTGELEEHLVTHYFQMSFKCNKCGLALQDKQKLVSHLKEHTKAGSKTATASTKETSRISASSTNATQSPLPPTLAQHFSGNSLLQHQRAKKSCTASTARKNYLISNSRTRQSVVLSCLYCPQRFVNRGAYANHLDAHKRRQLREKTYTLTKANNSKRLDTFQQHQNVNQNEAALAAIQKKHQCHLCSKSFYHSNTLKTHLIFTHNTFLGTSHSEKWELASAIADSSKYSENGSFERDDSSATDSSTSLTNDTSEPLASQLQQTSRKDDPQQNSAPYQCLVCHLTFTSLSRLSNHSRIHLPKVGAAQSQQLQGNQAKIRVFLAMDADRNLNVGSTEKGETSRMTAMNDDLHHQQQQNLANNHLTESVESVSGKDGVKKAFPSKHSKHTQPENICEEDENTDNQSETENGNENSSVSTADYNNSFASISGNPSFPNHINCSPSYTAMYDSGDSAAQLPTQVNSCPYCGECFNDTTILEAHIRRMHNEDRPYPCFTCNTSFRSSSHLLRHQRTATHSRSVDFRLFQ